MFSLCHFKPDIYVPAPSLSRSADIARRHGRDTGPAAHLKAPV